MSNLVQLSGTTGWFIVSNTKDNSTKLHLQNRHNWSTGTDGSPISIEALVGETESFKQQLLALVKS